MKAIVFVLALLSVSFVQGIFEEGEITIPEVDIKDKFIYVFRENIPTDQKTAFISVLKTFKGSVNNDIEILEEYRIGDFHAFLARAKSDVAAMTGEHPFIKYYTRDGIVRAQNADAMACQVVSSESWGLSRVNSRSLNLNGKYEYDKTGKGVNAYIIDTGIYIEHRDFGGRAVWGTNTVGDRDEDCNGHGTHVAGTVGGTEYGIAKETSLIAVKVLNCFGSGSWSGVINGINWVADQHKQRGKPSTANMSLGGGKNQPIDDAVNAAVRAGVVMNVAAGNDRGDACRSSPAAAELAITVGATQRDDRRSSFSAVGTCVDIFAPGTDITSAWIGSPNAVRTISGTSMATPHVCGVTAQILSANPSYTPQQVKDKVIRDATPDVINLDCASAHSSCPQSPNLLLYSSC